eukprot:14449118-Heterocapsa_arctica.AAC.1
MGSANAERVLDELMEQAQDMDYVLRGYPSFSYVDDGQTWESLPLKPLNPKLKQVFAVVDVVDGWSMPPGHSFDAMQKTLANGCDTAAMQSLPEGVRPKASLPAGALMQLIIQRNGPSSSDEQKFSVIKHIMLKQSIMAKDVAVFVSGSALCVAHRPNTFGAKKAFQQMLERLGGWRVLFASVAAKVKDEGKVKEDGPKWKPSKDEVTSGM